MPRYQINFYYLATGMEGRADQQDYGTIDAATPEEAKMKAARERHPNMSEQDIRWVMGCLSAKPFQKS